MSETRQQTMENRVEGLEKRMSGLESMVTDLESVFLGNFLEMKKELGSMKAMLSAYLEESGLLPTQPLCPAIQDTHAAATSLQAAQPVVAPPSVPAPDATNLPAVPLHTPDLPTAPTQIKRAAPAPESAIEDMLTPLKAPSSLHLLDHHGTLVDIVGDGDAGIHVGLALVSLIVDTLCLVYRGHRRSSAHAQLSNVPAVKHPNVKIPAKPPWSFSNLSLVAERTRLFGRVEELLEI